ncbi:transposase [Deinococcus arboris]
MGPMSARTHRGQDLIRPHPNSALRAERARIELDYGRRPTEGFVFGALQPHTGACLTRTYDRRNIATFVEFLDHVEAWIPAEIERIYVVLDNLPSHAAYDVLLFNLAHPRWEFVFQPKRAAYLNLIEPWWKTLKSLALKGRRFEVWSEVEQAVERATQYWNDHRHPFVWGRRRRHRIPKRYGFAAPPVSVSI